MRDHAEMELMLKGYGLTTAQILYHMPDHPHLPLPLYRCKRRLLPPPRASRSSPLRLPRQRPQLTLSQPPAPKPM